MNQERCGIIILAMILVSMLMAVPVKVIASKCDQRAAGEISFLFTNDLAKETCVQCTGPWFRSSKQVRVESGVKKCNFYEAEQTIFSPLGRWTCGFALDKCENISKLPVEQTAVFCVKAPSVVELTAKENELFSVVEDEAGGNAHGCSASSTSAFLGDNSKQEKSKRDTDTFLLEGQDADDVKVTLEADGNRGSNGGRARLRIRGNSLDEELEGALPLEISVILPLAGTYSIEIRQPKKPRDQRFRGGYIISVTSSAGINPMEPTKDVEN